MPPGPVDPADTIQNEALREIAAHGVIRSHRRGTVIFREGEPGDSLFVILKGRVEIFLSGKDGRKAIIGIRDAGDCLGEMSLGTEQTRSASVVCLEPCTFSVVTRRTLLDAMRSNPQLAMFLVTTLIQRARVATALAKEFALCDVYERVRRLLLEMAERDSEGIYRVQKPISQAEVGRRVGASRDMVNRIFKALIEGGYLRLVDRKITLSHGSLPSAY